jgi:DNA mismatch endonuclease (patch repair protein)
MILRRRLHASGLRFRTSVNLPGKPDVVFPKQRIAIFVDGDFWHGKNLSVRLAKLARGHNAMYWTAKIAANCARDRRLRAILKRRGWTVVRVWESDLHQRVESTTYRIVALVRKQVEGRSKLRPVTVPKSRACRERAALRELSCADIR